MARITNTQKNHLNKMNRAAKDVSLGTMLSNMTSTGFTNSSGSYTMVGSDYSGSSGSIQTNLGSSGLHGAMIQVVRAGSAIINPTLFTNRVAAGSIIVTGSGAGCVLTSDVVYWNAF